ncbi:hypothetical protein EC973_007338 [Apophysomyces ossiformis]|uniref:Uncharacterized protein n=1 Tax=Apophysomyces ossiformis TaxID=679940 RepID=A0A8H7BU95_9FUNG|nr:hypothetical protein EC973_007338 [Apophysomyces ossiformis]
MKQATGFLRMGNDRLHNANTVLDFVIMQLQNCAPEVEQKQNLGHGIHYVTRPWALVIVQDTEDIRKALDERAKSLKESETARKQRKWLEDIRIWALLCAFHVQSPDLKGSSNILGWIQNEKDGQPPSIIVVMDLYNGLIDILSLLVETSVYLSTHAREHWEQPLGFKTERTTDVLITDSGFLGDIPIMEDEPRHEENEDEDRKICQTIYNILSYYTHMIL